MVEIPILSEKYLIRIVNKQKSGIVAGEDGVKAEAVKYMIKNKKIRKFIYNIQL